MEGLSLETNAVSNAINMLLQEHNGQDISVLDLRGISNWTDYFIVATVTSKTHMDGLERHIKDFCYDKEIEMFGSSRTSGLRTKGSTKDTDDQWRLIDLGSVIVHLMTAEAREFYELERLWRPMQHA